ncbi:uncharacterized protein DUF3810 [Tenacibaculum adriaticum]|uniref:Uncharacterized protein DUF3810 n=1 Tax=Tenacibaculum adriaticum TaxID=413713 RepID=A0A5S5DVM4_9FLAO|nr:DUF3810 domain-containing protein [Tenacibaculum adriaticum]TYP99096.1 uncharacterized protein DUF3810 [Tenacibaculum adriaticum]
MKLHKKTLYLTILLPVQVLFVYFISQHPTWVEQYYSNGFYPVISKILRILLGWLPFSFGDTLGIILLVLLIRSIYKLIKNRFKNFIPQLLNFTAILSIIYFCFYCFWGLNYFREPLANSLDLQQSKYSTKQLVETTKNVIFKLNEYQFKITQNDTLKVEVPYSTKEIYNKALDGYKTLAKTYPQLNYTQPSVKSSLVSLMQSYNGTAGYLNPLTGEAHVNDMIPKTGYPATTCHEIAHQIGWSAENDANFVGFLAAIANKDIYFKYSGYRMAFYYLISDVRKRDEELSKQLWQTVNKGISKDFRASYLHWKQFDNPIEPYLKKGYNSYLKANKQEKGIASYSYVVDLLIAYNQQKTIL